MKELKLPSEKKKRFDGKRGFIAVLSVCAVAVLVAGYIAIDKSLTYTRPVGEPPRGGEAEQVEKPQQGVVEKLDPVSEPEPPSSEQEERANTVPEPTLLMWPVDGGTMLREYSAEALVFSPTMQDWRTHSGIDVAAPLGTAVRAMAAGRVTSVREDEMLGWTVEIAHGSYTASTENFLKTVNPKYVLISAGEPTDKRGGNTYGHPHSEPLENYLAQGIKSENIFWTWKNGTVVVETNGKNFSVTPEIEEDWVEQWIAEKKKSAKK